LDILALSLLVETGLHTYHVCASAQGCLMRRAMGQPYGAKEQMIATGIARHAEFPRSFKILAPTPDHLPNQGKCAGPDGAEMARPYPRSSRISILEVKNERG